MNEDRTVDTFNAEQTSSAPGSWGSFLAAVQFMTRLPLRSAPPTTMALNRCAIFFPLVGAMIGVFTAGVLGVCCLVWPVWLAVILAMATEARLTGALHEDGLADFFDAFGGGWTRAEVLTILKDSRIGTYGSMSLLLALLLRGGAIVAIVVQNGLADWPTWGSAIVASTTFGQWAGVMTMLRLPQASDRESLVHDIGGGLRWRDFLYSTMFGVLGVAPFALLSPTRLLLAMLLSIAVIWAFTRSLRRRLGGVTGDCLGCLCYVSQIVVLLAAAARID